MCAALLLPCEEERGCGGFIHVGGIRCGGVASCGWGMRDLRSGVEWRKQRVKLKRGDVTAPPAVGRVTPGTRETGGLEECLLTING